MKDENNGAIEFVGLRGKMYALCIEEKKNTKKAKSIIEQRAKSKEQHCNEVYNVRRFHAMLK